MDKRTLLAVLLIFIIFYISNKFLWKTPIEPKQAIQTTKKDVIPKSPISKESASWRTKPILFAGGEESLKEAELNENIVLENDVVKMVFTNRGGNIKQIYLKTIMNSDKTTPIEMLLSEKGLLNIKLNTEADTINLSNYILKYNKGEREVEFFLEVDNKKILQKSFHLQDDYRLGMNLAAEGVGVIGSYILGMDTGVYFDQKGDKRFQNYIKAVSQVDNKIEKTGVKTARKGKQFYGNIDWTVAKSKYFMLAAIPDRRIELREISVFADENAIKQTAKVEVARRKLVHHFDFYFGPVDYDNLRAYNIGLENSMEFGWKLIRPISKLILQLLRFLYKLIPNYGIAIIILSIIIKVVFYPLTHKGTRSAQKMQEIQPLVKEIQSKHKNNPQKMQQEMMKIYKEHGVSPLGGCLPMLLQFPIFFALYPILQTTIALRHANFALWIKDLSVSDPYYILPIVMGISMFLQQKLMSPKLAPNMDEKQMMQMKTQKMMMYGMPIFLVFIFASLPAGLVLYWLFYNILSIGEQMLVKKGGIRKAESGM
jgi:YidC/Oxa1 family membrane protein insertase